MLRAKLQTNWKVLSENSLENYHVEVVHPAYAKMVDVPAYEWKLEDVSQFLFVRCGVAPPMRNDANTRRCPNVNCQF